MSEARYHVEPLAAAGAVPAATLAEVFRAPWRQVAHVRHAAGAALGPRTLGDSEAMVFVTAGQGRAHLLHDTVEARAGTALTLFRDERLHLEADPGGEGLDLFLAEIGTG